MPNDKSFKAAVDISQLEVSFPPIPIPGWSCSIVYNALLPSIWHKKYNAVTATAGFAFPFPHLSLSLQQLLEENSQGSFWSLLPARAQKQ